MTFGELCVIVFAVIIVACIISSVVENVSTSNNITKKYSNPNFSTIDETRNLFGLITETIVFEVSVTLHSYRSLNKKYEYVKFDDDIKEITETVYNAYKEVITSNTMCISSSYIMNFIVSAAKINLLTEIQTLNASLYEQPPEE